MNFIKKVFDKKIDESVHSQFVRFGKGIYNNRAVIKLQKGKDSIKFNSTFEYANDFVELIFNSVDKASVSGIILSKQEINGLNGKKKAGAYEYDINREISANEIKELLKKAYYILIDIKAEGIEFKCKKKLPKPGKGGEGKVDDKFCVLKAEVKHFSKIKDEFFPDVPENTKKARASHTFEITEIVLPQGEKDYEKIRVLSNRAGKLIRHLEIDETETKKEIEFEA